MCKIDELKTELDEVKTEVERLSKKGDTAIRKLSAAMGKASSFSHDAKATSEATFIKVGDLEKLLYQWHNEDGEKNNTQDARISKLEGFSARALGVIATVAVFVSAFISGIAWVIHYAWDSIKGLFH